MNRIENITIAQCLDQGVQNDVHLIENATVVWQEDIIVWVGKTKEMPEQYEHSNIVLQNGGFLVPGLIDCHTHLAFGGWRADEFGERVSGTPYAEITKRGGGISSTVTDTRAASKEELIEKANGFLTEMTALGVTTVECKSGYGLNIDDEFKILSAYDDLKKITPLTLVSTFLGAHLVPKETSREDYCRMIIEEMIPKIAEQKLAEFCDIFIDDHAFTQTEARPIVEAAKAHGLKIKLHVDQLSGDGGAEFAADCGAFSADHLEYVSEEGIKALKKSGTIAVTLPLASLYTFQKSLDARMLIDAGLEVALATDFNPGSAPSNHLPLAMMLGCTLNRMSPKETLKAVTLYAAKAIDKADKIGSIEVGKYADFALIDTPSIEHWMYHFKANANCLTVKNGHIIYQL
ncbi:imidazolonepropionase [Candidatus Thioglobus sp.]|nr:imidazolonepropionase [Candidatus Thioglobus sp.]MDB9937627.1 imidazolonepropionase [Candidatus Thioglobus sp.]